MKSRQNLTSLKLRVTFKFYNINNLIINQRHNYLKVYHQLSTYLEMLQYLSSLFG